MCYRTAIEDDKMKTDFRVILDEWEERATIKNLRGSMNNILTWSSKMTEEQEIEDLIDSIQLIKNELTLIPRYNNELIEIQKKLDRLFHDYRKSTIAAFTKEASS